MFFTTFLRSPKRVPFVRIKRSRTPKERTPVSLLLERLEERCTPAVHDLTTGNSFTTIQAAVNAANPGDTLLADVGTYAENVTINKSLILEGAQHGVDARTRSGTDESIVTGAGNNGDTPFYITANNVTIDGFTVEDATNDNDFGYGIVEAAGTSGTQILNNIIQDNIAGLALANNPSGNAGLIQYNLFQNNNEPGAGSGNAIYSDQSTAGGDLANITIDSNAFSGDSNGGIILASSQADSQSSITVSNNTFSNEGSAVLLTNTTASSITFNTITGSTGSQIVIGDNDNNISITNNLIQNGATYGIRVINIYSEGPASNVSINLNAISGNDSAGLAIDNSGGTAYTGTLNAMYNWWGDISGPTIASNTGGMGQTIIDPSNQVTYRTWLIYGTDANPTAPGFQLPTTIDVTEGGDISPADNDYTRLANAIGSVQSGQTLVLSGTFNWTQPFSSAAWALGNDGVSGTDDDYTITAPTGVSSVTVTSASLGGATIQGPGSLTNSGVVNPILLPTFLAFNGPDQNWTISNLQIFDFNVGLEYNTPSEQTAFNGTTITNNHIVVPAPLNQTVAPNAFPENTGINYSFGADQTISNNQIDLNGGASSDSAAMNFAYEAGLLSNTSGGNAYNGLLVTGNTVNILNAQAADPEMIVAFWENSGSTASNITVSDNTVVNQAAGNNPALNSQIGFLLTSASSGSTTVLYQDNQASGTNVGFEYYPTYDNSGTSPVQIVDNTLTDVFEGFDFDNGALTVNYLSGNTATGTGAGNASIGIAVGTGSTLTTDGLSGTNSISGFATGVDVDGGTVTLQQNTISGNGTGVSVENSGTLTGASQNFIHNNTGTGISITASADTIGAITDNDLSGNSLAIANASSALIDASLNWWGSNTRAGVQGAISGSVDYTPFLNSGTDTESATPGFQGDFSILNVDSQSPQSGSVGRIQEGVNDVLAGGTVNVLSGTYAENVTVAKNLTLAGSAGSPPVAIIQPASGDGLTITAPATDVTVENLEVTGAANGVNVSGVATVTLQNLNLTSDSVGLSASGLTVLNLTDLTLTGNTSAGGTISNIGTINYTPLTGNTGAASTITGSTFQRGSDQAVNYSGVPTFNVIGSDGSDTFNVTPSASTTFTVSGGLPTPPATPGDVLNVNVAGSTSPTLTSTFNSATGYSGDYTFGNANAVNFNGIETLTPTSPAITSSDTATFTVGQSDSFTVTTTGTPAPTLTETGALPPGVTFTDNDNGTATIAGMPTTAGTFTFTITASNGIAPDATQIFTLTTVFSFANISGTVFFDYNDNGVQDPGDIGLSGRIVYLDLNHDGTLDPGDPTAITDADGNYVFSNVQGGTYTVREDVQFANVIVTSPAGDAYTVTLTGTNVTGLNFGNFLNNSVAPVEINTNLFGSPGSNTSADEAYIRGLYFALLGRDANRQLPQSNGTSISEVQYWLNQLNSGVTREQVAQDIVDSQEHRSLEVASYYETFLHRSGSASEIAYWVNVFESGATEATVVEGFLDSQEYQLDHVSDSSYVQALYVDVLGRNGSGTELSDQEAALNNGVTRAMMAQMFVQSNEEDQLAVSSFYGAYLHRAPDSGATYWEMLLQNNKASLGTVQAEILGDPTYAEFYNDGAKTVS